jgi:hypothetical protein
LLCVCASDCIAPEIQRGQKVMGDKAKVYMGTRDKALSAS